MNNITIPTAIQLANIAANLPLEKMNTQHWCCLIHLNKFVYADSKRADLDNEISNTEDVYLEAIPYIFKNGHKGKRWKFTGSVWMTEE